MPQQLPQKPILFVRYSDPRETVIDQEPQQEPRILAIRFLPAHSFRAYLRCVSDPQLKLQLAQQKFKPARAPLASIPSRTRKFRSLRLR
jgi:hypothetical protein